MGMRRAGKSWEGQDRAGPGRGEQGRTSCVGPRRAGEGRDRMRRAAEGWGGL